MTNEPNSTSPMENSNPSSEGVHIPIGVLYAVFLLSGLAALVYQLIWQRALFTIYGTNTESVTIVVAAFMMGLGLGSLMVESFPRGFESHCYWCSPFWRS